MHVSKPLLGVYEAAEQDGEPDQRFAVESSEADEFEQIDVEGEFMAFSVKRFAHGLYIFDKA